MLIVDGRFVLFGASHVVAVTIILVICSLIYIFRVKLRESQYYNLIRIGLGVLILVQELSLSIWRYQNDLWKIQTSLPLHLCGLAVLSTAIILFTKSEKFFQKIFFLMMIGAFLALVTPGISPQYGFPHFRFFQFFTSHGLIVINFSFILFVMNFQKNIRYIHLLYNFISGLLVALVMYGFNLLFDANYLYLMAKPGVGTAFDLFGDHPWYLLNILIFGVPIFYHLFYFPFFLKKILFKIKST